MENDEQRIGHFSLQLLDPRKLKTSTFSLLCSLLLTTFDEARNVECSPEEYGEFYAVFAKVFKSPFTVSSFLLIPFYSNQHKHLQSHSSTVHPLSQAYQPRIPSFHNNRVEMKLTSR